MPMGSRKWYPNKESVKMRNGWFWATDHFGQKVRVMQDFYDGEVFKGMAEILSERGPTGLPRECPGFCCRNDPSKVDCCTQKALYTQPDFQLQENTLKELVHSHGHKCIFYPKFHCKLNFIEQVWGEAKQLFHLMPCPRNEQELEQNAVSCLDNIPMELIQR